MKTYLLFPLMALLVTATQNVAYFFLYFRRKEKLLYFWSIAWTCYALRFLLYIIFRLGDNSMVFSILTDISSILNSFFLFAAIQLLPIHFGKYNKAANTLFILTTSASIFAQLFYQGQEMHHLPAFIYNGIIYMMCGFAFYRQKHIKPILRNTLFTCFILWGLHKLDYPFLINDQELAQWGFVFSIGLSLIISYVFLLIYFFEEWREIESQRDYAKLLFNRTPVGFFLADIHRKILDVNHSFANYCRRPLKIFCHVKSIMLLFPPIAMRSEHSSIT